MKQDRSQMRNAVRKATTNRWAAGFTPSCKGYLEACSDSLLREFAKRCEERGVSVHEGLKRSISEWLADPEASAQEPAGLDIAAVVERQAVALERQAVALERIAAAWEGNGG